MNESSEKYTRDFNTVYESYFSRYTSAMFSKHDVVEIDSKIFNDEIFKNMPEEAQMHLKDMIEAQQSGDALIAISNISLNPFISDNYEASTLTLAYSRGGGMYYGDIAVSGSLGKYMKVVGGIDALIPKNAIRQENRIEKEPVDMASLEKNFKSGFSKDIRQEKQD